MVIALSALRIEQAHATRLKIKAEENTRKKNFAIAEEGGARGLSDLCLSFVCDPVPLSPKNTAQIMHVEQLIAELFATQNLIIS